MHYVVDFHMFGGIVIVEFLYIANRLLFIAVDLLL